MLIIIKLDRFPKILLAISIFKYLFVIFYFSWPIIYLPIVIVWKCTVSIKEHVDQCSLIFDCRETSEVYILTNIFHFPYTFWSINPSGLRISSTSNKVHVSCVVFFILKVAFGWLSLSNFNICFAFSSPSPTTNVSSTYQW